MVLLLWTGGGWGAENDLTLSVTTREEYNDNVFYYQQKPMDDWITTITPSIEFKRTAERLNVSLDGRVASRRYVENESLNHLDQHYAGGVDVMITQRLSAGAEIGFVRDSARDRDVETTGILFTNVVRDSWTYQLGGNYRLSEISSIGLSAAFHEEAYEEDAEAEFDDFKYKQAGGSFSRYLTEVTTLSSQVSIARYEYPEQEVENYSGTIGISRQITETFSGYVSLGGRYTIFTYQTYASSIDPSTSSIIVVPVEIDIEKSGGVGNIGVFWQGEDAYWNVSAEHDLQATSGTSGATTRTGVTVSYLRRYTDRLSAGLTGSYFDNRVDDAEYSSGVDQKSFRVAPYIQYRMRDWIAMSAGCRYTRVEYIDNRTTENNAAWVMLSLEHDLFDW